MNTNGELGHGGEAQGVSRFPRGYQLVRALGRGGTAVAFEVVHLRTGERCVAKLLPDAALVDPTLAQRMRHEARILRRLRHPNIVSVLDWGRLDNGHPFLVLEYLDGPTVADEVRLRRIAVEEALAWTSQVLSALGAAHAAGLLHRDVSPENLLVCGVQGERIIKVCDFGFAKVLDEERAAIAAQHRTEDFTVVGSPYYVSPEAVRAEPLDARADLYQVGLVLYTMLTGYVPFSELEDTSAVLGARLYAELPPVAELRGASIPNELEGVLRKALARSPSDRFGGAHEFMAALAELGLGVEHAALTLCGSFSEECLEGPCKPTKECLEEPGKAAEEGLAGREALPRADWETKDCSEARDEPPCADVESAVARWLADIEGGSGPTG